MQSLRKLPFQRAINRSLFINQHHHARYLSLARPCWSENTDSKEQQSTTAASIEKFPWLLSQDSPRISKYPYEEAPRDWSFLNMLPMSLQHVLGKWLGTRILQLNTGYDNFPEQFLVGASLASRQAVSLLSDQINHQNKMEELQHILGPDLLHRYLESVPANTNIHINIPQIYDVNLGDIWITLGNSNAFSDERKYDVLRWMTVQIGLHKYKGKSELEESFQEYRERIAKSILEIRPRVESKDQMISTLGRVIVASGVRLGDVLAELNQEWYTDRTYIQQAHDLLNDNPGPVHIASTDAPMNVQINPQ